MSWTGRRPSIPIWRCNRGSCLDCWPTIPPRTAGYQAQRSSPRVVLCRTESFQTVYGPSQAVGGSTCSPDVPCATDEFPKAAVISWAYGARCSESRNKLFSQTCLPALPCEGNKEFFWMRYRVCIARDSTQRNCQQVRDPSPVCHNPGLDFHDGDAEEEMRVLYPFDPRLDESRRTRVGDILVSQHKDRKSPGRSVQAVRLVLKIAFSFQAKTLADNDTQTCKNSSRNCLAQHIFNCQDSAFPAHPKKLNCSASVGLVRGRTTSPTVKPDASKVRTSSISAAGLTSVPSFAGVSKRTS